MVEWVIFTEIPKPYAVIELQTMFHSFQEKTASNKQKARIKKKTNPPDAIKRRQKW